MTPTSPKHRSMRADDKSDALCLAIAMALTAASNDDVAEIGLRTGTKDRMDRHSRFWRSRQWDDPDQLSSASDIVPAMLSKAESLPYLERKLNLREFLKTRDPELYREVYGMHPELLDIETVAQAGQALSVPELIRHAERLQTEVHADLESALGSAKELLESTFKTILGEGNYGKADSFSELFAASKDKLSIPATRDIQGKDHLRRTVSALGQLVDGAREMRALYGRGHGRSRARELDDVHAHLVVNASVTLATYFLELLRQSSGD